MNKSTWLAVLCAAAMLSACSNLKDPANKAVANADASLSVLRDAAAQYAPEALAAVDERLTSFKKELTDGNFKEVMARTPAMTSAIADLKEIVAARKAEAMAALEKARESWTSLSTDLPDMIGAIESRVDILSKARRLPDNLSRATFNSAQSGLEILKSGWTDASNAFAAGDATGAVAKAQQLREQGMGILQSLGMTAS